MAVVHTAQARAEFSAFPEIIELNVGGQVYITRYPTLISIQGSLLWEMFSRKNPLSLSHDNKGRFFVDRDGFLFRYVLDYMRDQQLVLPDHFPERSRLKREAEYFKLPDLVKMLAPETGDNESNHAPSSSASASGLGSSPGPAGPSAVATRRAGYITLGYRGSYTLGRDSQTDAKFRRVARIMVCGKISLAKEVFGETLNESRDPDRPPECYTSRYYLKFNYLEQAFDKLANAGFHMVTSNSTGTCACAQDQADDKIWTSYTEYIFYRESDQEVPKFNNMWELKPHEEGNPSLQSVSEAPRFPTSSPEKHRELVSVAGRANSESVEPRRPEAGLSVPFVWPEKAPCSSRPESLSYQCFKHSGKARQLGQRWNKKASSALETGMEDDSDKDQASEEPRLMEKELDKCIEDFLKIKIPCTFPNKKKTMAE